MEVSIYSRKAIKELMEKGFKQNTAVISFYTPKNKRDCEENRVDYSGVCDMVFYVGIPDIDIEILSDYGYTYETYLAEADDLAKFIYEAKADGLDIVCQCDYGQSRSAACAAAILQHFEGRGIDVFADYKYYPNQLVYHKIFDALERMTSRTIKIEDCIWCDLKVSSNKCLYTFFPSHIPSEYGGVPDADPIQGTIVCDSNENASRCLQAIDSLIKNGYGKTLNWLIALDIGDIMTHIFNGKPIKYLHKTMDPLQAKGLEKRLRNAKTIFAYFDLPNTSKSITCFESVLEQMPYDTNLEIYTQASIGSTNMCSIDIWYDEGLSSVSK